MRNFFQKILILFTGNNYPEATQNEFYQWLVDEDHASQKEDALRELWNKAQRQKNVKGMQKSYERLKKQEGIPTVPKERRIRPIHIWQSAAAILFLLLASSVYLSTVGTKAETDLLQQYIPISRASHAPYRSTLLLCLISVSCLTRMYFSIHSHLPEEYNKHASEKSADAFGRTVYAQTIDKPPFIPQSRMYQL